MRLKVSITESGKKFRKTRRVGEAQRNEDTFPGFSNW